MNIISFVLVLSFIVFVHEFGHFIVAKLNKVKVHEFALGFGPTVLSKQGKETKYALRLLPLGGFVMMEGESEDSDEEGSFSRKKPLQRISILLAGPLMNFITSFIVLLIFMSVVGHPTTTLSSVVPNSPAYRAGIQDNDTILAINNTKVDSWNQVIEIISSSNIEDTIKLDLRRNNSEISKNVKPHKNEQGNVVIGIMTKIGREPGMVMSNTFRTFKSFFTAIGDFLVNIPKEGVSDVVGPIGLFGFVSQVQQTGAINLLFLVAFISVNVGILNLLPIPAFDGGRILLVLVEMIIRRPINKKIENAVNMLGFALILTLFVFTFYNDIRRLVVGG